MKEVEVKTAFARLVSALKSWPLAVAATVLGAGPALAHEAAGIVGGFQSGVSHPIAGLDHVVAMVAVGLLGAVMGPPAVWILPIVFPLVMAVGGAAGVAGVPLAGVETGIAVSAVVLGLLVAIGRRMPLWIAASVVGFFAVFHGHAHGAELPAAADAVAYAAASSSGRAFSTCSASESDLPEDGTRA